MIILVLNFVSAGIITSVDKYDEKLKTYSEITLKERAWYDVFGWTEKQIVTNKLIEHSNQCLIKCSSRGISTLSIDGALFDKIEFYKKNGINKAISYHIYIKGSEEYDIQTPVYKKICDIIKDNATRQGDKEYCRNVIIDYTKEKGQREVWNEYNFESLKAGTYEWKIEVNKKPTESIDWIATSFNTKLNGWAWWNTNWSAKQPIRANFTAGATTTAYQIEFNVTYTSGMNVDFSDLRFTNAGETAELDYWIEQTVNSSWAWVWINVTTPINTTNQTIAYMYYNNPATTTTTSNGTNTFFVFDDFNRPDSETVGGGWVENNEAGNAINITDGKLVIRKISGGNPYPTKTVALGTNVRAGYRLTSYAGNSAGVALNLYDAGLSDIGVNVQGFRDNNGIYIFNGVQFLQLLPATPNNYYTVKVYNTSSSTKKYRASVENLINTSLIGYSGLTTDFGIILLVVNTVETGRVDWIYAIKEYIDSPLAIGFGNEELNTGITVDLNSPTNNNVSSNATQDFNCSAVVVGMNIQNISLYTNLTGTWALSETQTKTGTSNSSLFTKTLPENSTKWNCLACTDTGDCSYSLINYTVIVHTTAPIITATVGNGTNEKGIYHQNHTLNYTVVDDYLNKCWYVYGGVTNALNCTEAGIFINITRVSDNLTIYANDTLNNTRSQLVTWDFKIIESNQTYQANTMFGNLENYYANITVNPAYSVSSIFLYYNGTASTGDSFILGDNTILRKANLQVPYLSGNSVDFTFNFQVVLNDATIINLTSKNQTAQNITLDNCTANTIPFYNLFLKDEDTQNSLTLDEGNTIETYFSVYSLNGNLLFNHSEKQTNITSASYCLNRIIPVNTNYTVDVIIKYYATNYSVEYYNIRGSALNNETTTQNISLYDLLTTRTTEFKFKFIGSDFLPVENALIYITRQYVSEGVFKLVELPITDSNGQTILHLVRNDILYNIIVVKDNVILGTYSNIVAFCDDITIGNCQIQLYASRSSKELDTYDDIMGILFTPITYNRATRTVSFNFVNINSSVSKHVSLNITRTNYFGTKNICNNSLTGTGGTITCVLPVITDNSEVLATVFIDGEEALSQIISLNVPQNYGEFGFFIALILVMTLVFMFSYNKTTMVLSVLVGFIICVGFGLIQGSVFGLGSAGIWLIVIVLIMLYKLNKRKPY